jgi:glycolate oxidase FAD binding subunit
VEAACTHLGGERKDNARAAADWQALRDQQLPWFATAEGPDALWRLSVPQTAPVLAIDGGNTTPLIEWHGGQRWYKAPPDQAARIREIARAAGGHATLFRAACRCRRPRRFDALSAPVARIHRALMQEFDPHRIFNRGRLFADE